MSQENSLTLATIKDNIRKIRASYNLNDVSNSSGISCENEQMRTVEEQHHEEVFNHLEGNIHIKSVESSSHSLSVPLNVDCFVVATISNECSGICSSYARNSSSSVSYVDAKFSGGGIEQFFATNDKSKKSSIKENNHGGIMTRIKNIGNKPEDWKSYIDFLKLNSALDIVQSRHLSDAYSNAFSAILSNREHKTQQCAQMTLDFSQHCREVGDFHLMDTIFDLARPHFQDFAIIVVCSAELKLNKGDRAKALYILRKALAKARAKPKDLLVQSIRAVEAGQKKLLSDSQLDVKLFTEPASDQMCPTLQPATGDHGASHFRSTEPITDVVEDAHSFSVGDKLACIASSSSSFKGHRLAYCYSTPSLSGALNDVDRSSQCISNSGLLEHVRQEMGKPAERVSGGLNDDGLGNSSIKSIRPTNLSFGSLTSSCASSGFYSRYIVSSEDRTSSYSFNGLRKDVSQADVETVCQGEVPNHSTVKPVTSLSIGPKSTTPLSHPSLCFVMQDAMDVLTIGNELYAVMKKVGHGGSAMVYMALDSDKNTRAIKVVQLAGLDRSMVDGYRNEVALLQRLQYCQNVIKMYNHELNEEKNTLCMVLEFGETDLSGFFASCAKQREGMDPALIKFYWSEMLKAVNALHSEGVIHSDLKPANFLLVLGKVKLIDFGIANSLQQDKTSMMKELRVGTPSYMSPEAMMAVCDDNGDEDGMRRPRFKVGIRSDVWSLGCILYNMVYGKTPFQHIRNNFGKMHAITNPECQIKFPHHPDSNLVDVLKKLLEDSGSQ